MNFGASAQKYASARVAHSATEQPHKCREVVQAAQANVIDDQRLA